MENMIRDRVNEILHEKIAMGAGVSRRRRAAPRRRRGGEDGGMLLNTGAWGGAERTAEQRRESALKAAATRKRNKAAQMARLGMLQDRELLEQAVHDPQVARILSDIVIHPKRKVRDTTSVAAMRRAENKALAHELWVEALESGKPITKDYARCFAHNFETATCRKRYPEQAPKAKAKATNTERLLAYNAALKRLRAEKPHLTINQARCELSGNKAKISCAAAKHGRGYDSGVVLY
jgi:hypothetical protein